MSTAHPVRPLPPQPSLEFERKEAKKLCRQLRAGDAAALARTRAHLSAMRPDDVQLADAQLVIAREYGFASWPKLTRYFSDSEPLRHRQWAYFAHDRKMYEGTAHWLMSRRDRIRARFLSAYVPRFYGQPIDALTDAVITEDEARLAAARTHGFVSWDALMKRSDEDEERRKRIDAGLESMYTDAVEAMKAADLTALQELVARKPELLEAKDHESGRHGTLLYFALGAEQLHGVAAMKPIMDWLVEQGFDLNKALQQRLCGTWPGDHAMKTETVRGLLARGCDPDWVAPNGISVLEHALLMYGRREAVDVLAEHARPRDALWVTAGLGDVEGVARHLDRSGWPKPSAYQSRPNFEAAGTRAQQVMILRPDPEPEELLFEAFFVAMLNERVEVMNYMISRGFPVNSLVHGFTLLEFAAGYSMPEAVECLVRGGADSSIGGAFGNGSARNIARELFTQTPTDERRRRVAELCGVPTS